MSATCVWSPTIAKPRIGPIASTDPADAIERGGAKAPPGMHIVFEDIAKTEREWHGPVPVTTVSRTLRDCVSHHVALDLVRQAIRP